MHLHCFWLSTYVSVAIEVDWENWITKGYNTNSHEYKFVETIQDIFLYQHTRKQQDGEAQIPLIY
jgi:hypothetical protein